MSDIKATENIKKDNRWYRVAAEEARKHCLPEHEWVPTMASAVIQKIGTILEQRVPLNEVLVENLRNEAVRNPILCGHDWWPYVGSQRLRALQHLWVNEGIDSPILVCRIKKNILSIWDLWGGQEGKRCQAIQVQLYEILFKSMYYQSDTTTDGKKMVDFEEEGDKMYWSVRDDNPQWKNFGKDARKNIAEGNAGDVKDWKRTD